MDIENIYRALRPLKNRMHLNNAILSVIAGFASGGAGTFALSSFAVFFPVTYLVLKLIIIFSSCIAVSLIAAAFLRPKNLNAIKKADSLGLQERLITAFELKDDDSDIAKIQRLDALKAASSSDFKVLYRLKFPGRICLAGVLLSIITTSTFLIPSRPKEEARREEKLTEEVVKESEKLSKARDEINKKAGIPKDKLAEMNRETDKLLNELKEAKKEEDAVKALSMAEHRIEDLKSSKNDGMGKLADSLMKNSATKELSDALKSGKRDDVKKALQDLKKKLDSSNEKDKKELADLLKNAAEDTKNKSVSQSLKDLSSSVSSGNSSKQASALSSLENSLNGSSSSGEGSGTSEGSQLEEALGEMGGSIDDAKDSISMLGDGNGQMQAQNSGDSASGGGEGNGAEGENGEGSGSGQNGNGTGGGGGAGSGSTNKDAGYSGEESGSSQGRAPGEKQVKDYESIYVPERLGGDSQASQVKGIQGKQGQSTLSDAKDAPVQKGEVLPYNQVLGEYKDNAMSAIDNSAVPPSMKDAVRDYFTSLD